MKRLTLLPLASSVYATVSHMPQVTLAVIGTPFFRKLAQGVGPAVALVIMAKLGYVNNAVDELGTAYI